MLYLLDRTKDMIISGGSNVYAVEVEQVLSAHPDVGDVAVIGVPDDLWGEVVVAVVVPTGGDFDPTVLEQHCRAALAGYKIPRRWLEVESLPRNAYGKVVNATSRSARDCGMSDQSALARLLSPASLAVVGANESLGMSNNAVLPMLEAGRTVHLVNPNRQELYGLPALPSLSALGAPVDAVLSLVNAERSVAVVEEAAALGCGGVVVAAAGFSEMGEAGSALQSRIQEVARGSGLAVIGPNCSGFKNVPLGVNLFTGGRIDPPSGGVSIVSQSGFLMRSALAAAAQRRLGVAIAVSSGNEAVCDLADYVEALIEDPSTSVVCLVIETIRRPAAFFSAVARAHRAGMSVLALKLGRSDRSRQIVQSHTGSIAGDSWVYELAFAEHGIVSACDVDDLFDRAQLLAQLPVDRRSTIGRIAIITTSGGVAALATDLADSEGLELPTLEELAPWVRERVPGDTVNPLDLTGFVMTQPDVMRELFDRYAGAVDSARPGVVAR